MYPVFLRNWNFYYSISVFSRKGFLGATIINATAGLLSAFSPNYVTLLTLRFIMGIGLGGAYLFTTWFLEFVPTTNRGSWMIIFSSFWTIGIMCEASLAWVCMSSMLDFSNRKIVFACICVYMHSTKPQINLLSKLWKMHHITDIDYGI